MSFLGIDVGTSFIKGAALNLATRRLDHAERIPFPQPVAHASPLYSEYDPEKVVEAVRALIEKLTPHIANCEGMVTCSQMHGLVLVNHQGAPVSNCITWRDQRTLEPHPSGSGTYFDVLLARTDASLCRELGNELEPARPVSFLFWFAEQGKLAPGLLPASLPDFVLSRLCGSMPGVEATNASAYGALNLKTLDWHQELIEKLHLDHLHWPRLRKLGEIVGELKVASKTVPCYTPVGDAQAALAGALLASDELSLNIATGAQVSRLRNELALDHFQSRPYFDGKFLNTFSYPPAGRELNVLVRLLVERATAEKMNLGDAWVYIQEATEQIRSTDVDLRFSNPFDDHRGMSNTPIDPVTVGYWFRAAFKAMAETYYECALRLWPEKEWKSLLLSGGLAWRLKALRDTIRERFALGYRLSPFQEDTLFGLLMLACVFSGQARTLEEISNELRLAIEAPHDL